MNCFKCSLVLILNTTKISAVDVEAGREQALPGAVIIIVRSIKDTR